MVTPMNPVVKVKKDYEPTPARLLQRRYWQILGSLLLHQKGLRTALEGLLTIADRQAIDGLLNRAIRAHKRRYQRDLENLRAAGRAKPCKNSKN